MIYRPPPHFVAMETVIASAIFMVDDTLALEPACAAGAQLAARIQRKLALSPQEARKRVEAYKQFLVLKAVTKDFDATQLSPPPLVDAVWHEHILDTRGYSVFCLTVFLQVVHHDPNGDLDGTARDRRRRMTLGTLKTVFKDNYDKEIWAYPGALPSKRGRGVVEQEDTPASRTRRRSFLPPGQLTIRIKDQTGEETFYKVKKTTKLENVLDAYATRRGVPVDSLRFLFSGSRVHGDQTPADIEMVDGDQLDCMLEQGGC